MTKSLSRNIILDTSEALFNAYGFHAVGVDRIREVSGVSKVTMYKQFKSKKDLIIEVLKRRDDRFIESLQKKVDSGDTVEDKINNFIEWHITWFSQLSFNGCMFVSANKELGVTDIDINDIAKAHKQRIFDIIINIFDKDRPLYFGLASAFYLYIEGATAEATLSGYSARIAQSREIFTQWLIDNL